MFATVAGTILCQQPCATPQNTRRCDADSPTSTPNKPKLSSPLVSQAAGKGVVYPARLAATGKGVVVFPERLAASVVTPAASVVTPRRPSRAPAATRRERLSPAALRDVVKAAKVIHAPTREYRDPRLT